MKKSEVVIGAKVAERRSSYYSEPTAGVILSDKPMMRRRYASDFIDAPDWQSGGVLVDFYTYKSTFKLAQLVPHADAIAQYKDDEDLRKRINAASSARSEKALAAFDELNAIAPSGISVSVSSMTLLAELSGSINAVRKLLEAAKAAPQ